MNVHLFARNTGVSFFKETFFHSISPQKKRIILIVSIAFSLLAICYMISRWCKKAKVLNGQAKKIDPVNGKIEKNVFKEDKLQGQGKVTFRDGSIGEGEFKDGVLSGQGTMTRPDGSIEQGEFRMGSLYKGKITHLDGKVWEGTFENGKLYEGKITHRDGKVWDGTFENGKLNGPGKFIDEDKEEIGIFKEGLLFGDGRMIYSDGTEKRGWFENGIPMYVEQKDRYGQVVYKFHKGMVERIDIRELTPEQKAEIAIVPDKMSYVNAFRALWEKAETPAGGFFDVYPEKLAPEEEVISTSEKVAKVFQESYPHCYLDYQGGRRMKVCLKISQD